MPVTRATNCHRNHLKRCLAGAAFLALSLAPVAQAAEFPRFIRLSSLDGVAR